MSAAVVLVVDTEATSPVLGVEQCCIQMVAGPLMLEEVLVAVGHQNCRVVTRGGMYESIPYWETRNGG